MRGRGRIRQDYMINNAHKIFCSIKNAYNKFELKVVELLVTLTEPGIGGLCSNSLF